MKRFGLLIMVVMFLVSSLSVFAAGAGESEEIILANSFRNAVNEYWLHWNAGGKNAVEKGLGLKYLGLSADDDEAKQVGDIESAIAQGVKAVAVMPATAGALGAIVDLCESNSVYLVSMWDRPKELIPGDYEFWVAHVTMDTVAQGYVPAKHLFEKMGGEGNVVALGGIPGTGSAEDRQLGLNQAADEFPGIKLLDYQTGMYNRVDAVKVMEDFLTAYGDDINGVWAANDDMSIGAIEVLKPLGLAGGKILISGVDATKEGVKAIVDGDMYTTVTGDPFEMSGIGMLYAYLATQGKILPEADQIIVLPSPIVDPSNAADYFKKTFAGERSIDWERIMADIEKGM